MCFCGYVRSDSLAELALSTSIHRLGDLNLSFFAWLEVVYHRKLHAESGQSALNCVRMDTAPALRPVDPLLVSDLFPPKNHVETRPASPLPYMISGSG